MVALADGELSPHEEKHIREVATNLQIQVDEIDKIIREELRKLPRKGSQASTRKPQLEVSQKLFTFQHLKAGVTVQGRLVLSNTGGGILQGPIRSNRAWLKPHQSQIDTATHQQQIGFDVDTVGLPLGLEQQGQIEIRSNGGTGTVLIQLSTEIPDAALARFRKILFWTGFLGGGVFGYSLYQLLPTGASTETITGVAGFVAIIAAIAIGSRIAGFAGGCSSFIFGPVVLGILAKAWPAVFSILSWAITYGVLLHLTSRALFIARQTKKKTVMSFVAVGAVLLPLVAVIGGLFLATEVGSPNTRRQTETLAAHPVIASINQVLNQADQNVTITGSGFGNQTPYKGNSRYILITDLTRNWSAGGPADCRSLRW